MVGEVLKRPQRKEKQGRCCSAAATCEVVVVWAVSLNGMDSGLSYASFHLPYSFTMTIMEWF